MRRRWAGTSIRRLESNSTVSASMMRPRSGAIRPAIMLTSVVLPAPEGPNKAVTPAALAKRAAIEKPPSRFSTSTASISFSVEAHAGAAGEPFGDHQRRERNRDRDQHQPARRRVAARALRE